jgi:hypothetical protein
MLNTQRIIAAMNILQKEIETALTPTNALPIIGDVLTDKRAKIRSKVIFVFIIL